MSGCRKSALSSKFILASSAPTLPSPVRMSGLISARLAPVSSNAWSRPCRTARGLVERLVQPRQDPARLGERARRHADRARELVRVAVVEARARIDREL